MKTTPRRKDNSTLKGFTLECGLTETLVIVRALELLLLNQDVPLTDKRFAGLILKSIRCLNINYEDDIPPMDDHDEFYNNLP